VNRNEKRGAGKSPTPRSCLPGAAESARAAGDCYFRLYGAMISAVPIASGLSWS